MGARVPSASRIIPARAGFTVCGSAYGGHACWIIPARAGFTPQASAAQSSAGDHPRSRGVYSTVPYPRATAQGSSPLARGLPAAHQDARDHARIIPARAGFTDSGQVWDMHVTDHPRSRGVYADAQRDGRGRPGSSPLARGLHDRVAFRSARARIIPARAGFTAVDPVAVFNSGDHPRSRGVYRLPIDFLCMTHGSSPLARGLHPLIISEQ